MKSFKIKIKEIVDALLAYSSLRGDVTGRGDLLVDNDEYAIANLLKITVPGLLADNNISFRTVKSGWHVSTDAYVKEQLLSFLLGRIIDGLTGSESTATVSLDRGGSTPVTVRQYEF